MSVARLRRRRGFGSEKALSVRRDEGGEGKEADNVAAHVASADESVKGIREKRAEYFASVGLRSAGRDSSEQNPGAEGDDVEEIKC